MSETFHEDLDDTKIPGSINDPNDWFDEDGD